MHELLPRHAGWQLLLLGTDINEAALQKAQQGIYNEWSFRMVEPELRSRYFHLGPKGYELEPQIRRMVTFRHGNLRHDPCPDPAGDTHDMDLILCRNVLIYFDPASVAAVLRKFEATLAPGGYLVTGHAELNHQNLGQLRTQMFPQSVVYQRSLQTRVAPPGQLLPVPSSPAQSQSRPVQPQPATPRAPVQTPPVASQPSPRPPAPRIDRTTLQLKPIAMPQAAPTKVEAVLQQVKALLNSGAYSIALEKLEELLRHDASNFAALALAAQAYANLGQHEKAAAYCRQAIAMNSFAPAPYHLLAHIVEEQGQADEAKTLLKKVIYLAPAFVAAYLDLGALYQRAEDHNRARQMRKTARELLQQMPAHEVVEACHGLTAAAAIEHLQEMP